MDVVVEEEVFAGLGDTATGGRQHWSAQPSRGLLIMVAVQAIDEITDPTKVIQRLYDDDGLIHSLPSAVTKHFAHLFLGANDPHALYQVTDISQPFTSSLIVFV